MELFLFLLTRKVINIAYFDSFHAKKNFYTEKNSSNTNLFATLAHVKILFTSYALIKFEVFPAKTWKISRGIFLELP